MDKQRPDDVDPSFTLEFLLPFSNMKCCFMDIDSKKSILHLGFSVYMLLLLWMLSSVGNFIHLRLTDYLGLVISALFSLFFVALIYLIFFFLALYSFRFSFYPEFLSFLYNFHPLFIIYSLLEFEVIFYCLTREVRRAPTNALLH